ncbi:alpha-D-ribose 1-methylphosphonate 5-triphosphate diphosphatase [Rhodovulum imhoffii]|uniref:Alpha-D-ribose 1-methylphosphonate 5-triphosphate diphosphatase n=1 Tax=Rhodovulum imhoffii TaxID=365340 RepID=A0A2T5BPS2_9RHOB|nr:alpha-D-ribose 1-methylphosphonate 5-triphosphate diphosphatase [Rhodovulum imhoffii]MBK5933081.1 phosphonate metabolism protein PhnM [Rhodovulum imhoffii]PTN01063.1 alpha-D-ribose 1-methylphosphonate 5-triphosphate diphosphatase [Rhodovulum imhoffii]
MSETILANATLVLPDETVTGAMVLRDGHIAGISTGKSVPKGAIDCDGDMVLPGLIELHTDNLERHIQPRPKVDWPHASAIIAHDAELAGVGITTVFDAMRVGSIPTGAGRYAMYARQLASEMLSLRERGALRISHYLHLRAEICSQTLREEMAAFGPEDRVGIVSLMDHTPGQRQFRNITKYRDYFMGKNHATQAQFIEHVAVLRELRDQFGDAHERAAVAEAARYGAVLASHDDTTSAHVQASAALGIRLAEFPTTHEAARACHASDIAVMMGAPNLIRGGSHSGNVAASDLAQAGVLDIVSSDYVPSSLLMAAVMLGDLWDDMARGIATVTRTPADAVNLPDRGRLETGARADVIRVTRVDGTPVVRGTWVQGLRVA